MRIQYDAEADILLFVLRDLPPVDAVEEPGGVVISYGEDGEAVSVEFLHASARHLIQTGEISVTLQTERAPVGAGGGGIREDTSGCECRNVSIDADSACGFMDS